MVGNIPRIEASAEQKPTNITTTSKVNPRGTGEYNVFTLTKTNPKIEVGMKVTSDDGVIQLEEHVCSIYI